MAAVNLCRGVCDICPIPSWRGFAKWSWELKHLQRFSTLCSLTPKSGTTLLLIVEFWRWNPHQSNKYLPISVSSDLMKDRFGWCLCVGALSENLWSQVRALGISSGFATAVIHGKCWEICTDKFDICVYFDTRISLNVKWPLWSNLCILGATHNLFLVEIWQM